jgi:hypothetical protein
MLDKLNFEIKKLQEQNKYESKVNKGVREYRGLVETKYVNGPMKIAALEYERRRERT